MEIKSISSFLEYYDKIRTRTMRVIMCIPEERIDWTHREGEFSFGDLIRHMGAIQRHMFAENVQNKPSRYAGHGKYLAESYHEVLKFFASSYDESIHIFRKLSDEDLEKKCLTPGGIKITIWKWLRAMVEHEIHHRGQIYVYLNLLNIPTPPLYGLTSEEVKERSI